MQVHVYVNWVIIGIDNDSPLNCSQTIILSEIRTPVLTDTLREHKPDLTVAVSEKCFCKIISKVLIFIQENSVSVILVNWLMCV